MATLNVKNFPDALHKKLRLQAKRHARSIASEVKVILAEEMIRIGAYALDDSRDDRDSVAIRHRGAGKVAPTSIAGLKETVHLLRSPKNAARIAAALQRATTRKLGPSPPNLLKKKLGLARRTGATSPGSTGPASRRGPSS
jgi:antitoxin YefM